jgi:hypothetical protein
MPTRWSCWWRVRRQHGGWSPWYFKQGSHALHHWQQQFMEQVWCLSREDTPITLGLNGVEWRFKARKG